MSVKKTLNSFHFWCDVISRYLLTALTNIDVIR